MKITVEKEHLEELLKGKKTYINRTIKQSVPFLSFSVSLFLASLVSEFKNFLFLEALYVSFLYYSVVIISLIIGVIYLIIGLVKPYTHDDLLNEIIELSKPHSFAIILMQNKHTKKYLLYVDNRWKKCKLFLNIYIRSKKHSDNYNDIILNNISDRFGLQKGGVKVSYDSKLEDKKWSPSDKTIKRYKFYFYKFYVDDFPSYMQENQFEHNGIKYQWVSVEEMKMNKKIMKMNRAVVERVGEINTI